MKTSVVLALIAPVCVGAFVVSTTGVPPAAPRLRFSACIACADAGPLAGAAFWDSFSRTPRRKAADLGCAIKKVSFANGKLSVLAQDAGVDELQQLNTRLCNSSTSPPMTVSRRCRPFC